MNALRLFAILCCCAGCGTGHPDNPAQATPATTTTTPAANTPVADRPAPTDPGPPPPPAKPDNTYPDNQQHGNEIRIVFGREKDAATVRGHLGKPGNPVTCYLEMNANQELTASVRGTKGAANIRFNRILLPDGTSDGPFGATLTHNTRQTGVYQLEIGTNLMAENAYEGDFTLDVQVR